MSKRRVRLEDYEFLLSKRPGALDGVVKRACGGNFARFHKGDKVRVWKDKNGTLIIERKRWYGSTVPLAHSCYNIDPNDIEIL